MTNIIAVLSDLGGDVLMGFLIGFAMAVITQRKGWWGDRELLAKISDLAAHCSALDVENKALKEQLARLHDEIRPLRELQARVLARLDK